MKWILTTLLMITAAFGAHAESCGSHLKAFTLWEDKVKGKIVDKASLFEIPDWDPNSQFNGIVLTKAASKTLKEPVLEIEYRGLNKGKRKFETFKELAPFEHDPSLKVFTDFDTNGFFNFPDNGSFSIRLKDQGQVICSETHRFSIGD